MSEQATSGKVPARQKLMETMMRRHLISADLANYHIAKLTDSEVNERLMLYDKQSSS